MGVKRFLTIYSIFLNCSRGKKFQKPSQKEPLVTRRFQQLTVKKGIKFSFVVFALCMLFEVINFYRLMNYYKRN